jgi:hypothetical protein
VWTCDDREREVANGAVVVIPGELPGLGAFIGERAADLLDQGEFREFEYGTVELGCEIFDDACGVLRREGDGVEEGAVAVVGDEGPGVVPEVGDRDSEGTFEKVETAVNLGKQSFAGEVGEDVP